MGNTYSKEVINNLDNYGRGLANSLLGIGRFTGNKTNELLEITGNITPNEADVRNEALNNLLSVPPTTKNHPLYDVGGLAGDITTILGALGPKGTALLTSIARTNHKYGETPIVKGARQTLREYVKPPETTEYLPQIKKQLPASIIEEQIKKQLPEATLQNYFKKE